LKRPARGALRFYRGEGLDAIAREGGKRRYREGEDLEKQFVWVFLSENTPLSMNKTGNDQPKRHKKKILILVDVGVSNTSKW